MTSSPDPEAGRAGPQPPAPGGPAGPDGGMPGIPDDLPTATTTRCPVPGRAAPVPGRGLAAGHVAGEPARRRVHRPHLPGTSCTPTAATCSSGWPLIPDPRGSRRSARRCGRSWAATLILAGNWDRQNPDDWPEQIRPAVAFAMGMITELEENGADLGARHLVRLDDPDAATVGVPFGITAGRAAAPGSRRADTGTPAIAGAGARGRLPPLPLSRHPACGGGRNRGPQAPSPRRSRGGDRCTRSRPAAARRDARQPGHGGGRSRGPRPRHGRCLTHRAPGARAELPSARQLRL